MRTKISHKLLLLNLSIIFVLTAVFSSYSYLSSKSLYSDAVNGIDIQVMKDLAKVLGKHYEDYGHWDQFIEDPQAWETIVQQKFGETFVALMKKARERFSEQEKQDLSHNQAVEQVSPITSGTWKMPFGTFHQRLTLMNTDKQPIIIASVPRKQQNLHPIYANREKVGWLSVGTVNFDMLPLTMFFYEQQMKVTYTTAIIVGILAAILSFVFSRRITAPIKKLTDGAKQIAKRNYSNSIEINTTDELQDLAESFNRISTELSLFETRQKQWIMDISHELRTPISILLTEMSAICDNLTKCDTHAIALLKTDVLQIKRLVEDLHDLSIIENNSLQFNKSPTDVIPLIKSITNQYLAAFQDRAIGIQQTYSDTPLIAIIDQDRFIQVIRNLLENCLKYTDSPGNVFISCQLVDGAIRIEVEDTGPGVPSSALEHIFDRLYRVDQSRNRLNGGAGLGLSICKQIILAHEGTIAASHSDQGGLNLAIQLKQYKNYE